MVASDGCDVAGVRAVALVALVFMGEAVNSGMPGMIAAGAGSSAACAVFYEAGPVRGWRTEEGRKERVDGRKEGRKERRNERVDGSRECEGAWNAAAVTTLGIWI